MIYILKNLSSNVNEIIRPVLNSIFFTKRLCTHQKHKQHQKHQKYQKCKSTKTQPSKSTKRYKRTNIKNALNKHIRRKKSLIRLFAFLCFLCARRKKQQKKEKSLCNVNALKIPVSPQHSSCKHTYTYMNLVVGTRTQSTFQPHKNQLKYKQKEQKGQSLYAAVGKGKISDFRPLRSLYVQKIVAFVVQCCLVYFFVS